MSKRALISVYDKTGVVEFASELVKNGFEIVSTSGTAKLLKESGIRLKTIEEITKAPEVLGGRVKTLQHFIFAGILADKNNKGHLAEVEKFGFELFDLVAVSLYPFSETISRENCSVDEAIEQIDIGGVSLIRAAAKNYSSVSVLVTPDQYDIYLDSLNYGKDYNLQFASDAFSYIAWYDTKISNYFKKLTGENSGRFLIDYSNVHTLRYGENPHQAGELYDIGENSFSKTFEKLHGKELSYINILDIDAAFYLIKEFSEPTCAILKHTNPSGVACDNNITEAYLKALSCDNVSRFGGIIIFNREVDLITAQEIDKIKTDILIAPGYSAETLEFLTKKKNRVLIKYNENAQIDSQSIKSVYGGILVQQTDKTVVNENALKVVTERKPTDAEMKDMLFAMKVCKHTKSNAVVYVKDSITIGIGAGQPSRVDSSRLAVTKAKRFGFDLTGCSVASDAFFPFPDGVIEAAKAGAKAVIQPGGSVKDDEVIKAANEYGLAMVLSGIRHFKH